MVPLPGFFLLVPQCSDQQAMAFLCAITSVEDTRPLPILVGYDLGISSPIKSHIWEKIVLDSVIQPQPSSCVK